MMVNNLVGGIPTPLKKYAKVSWDDEIPNIRKNKKCSKPPIQICMHIYICIMRLLVIYTLHIV